MFKSLYRLHQNEGRIQPEAVLNFKGVLVMILIFLAEQLGADGIAILADRMGYTVGLMELNLMVNAAAMVLLLLFFGRFLLESLKNFFREFKAIYIWLPIACYFCSTLANIIVNLILGMVRGKLQATSNNELVLDMLSKNPLPLVLLTVFFAPIIEEAVFRAAICRPLTAHRNWFVKTLGFGLSVLLFSLMHVLPYILAAADTASALDELLSIVVYIPMAIGLTLCAVLGKNYWCSVICHMLTNGMAVGLALLLGQQS
jgi:Predicted protease of the Abi (CAAX) family